MSVKKIIKTCGHCYDSMGNFKCDFWFTVDEMVDFGKSRTVNCCVLFNSVEKKASESLVCCDKIYGRNYEGRP